MASRNPWVRPGTAPVAVAFVWALGVTLYFLSSPVVDRDGERLTVVEAGGLLALLVFVLPVVLCAVPLFQRTSPRRTRTVLGGALLLTLLAVLAPTSLGLYLVSAGGLWFAWFALRREGPGSAQT